MGVFASTRWSQSRCNNEKVVIVKWKMTDSRNLAFKCVIIIIGILACSVLWNQKCNSSAGGSDLRKDWVTNVTCTTFSTFKNMVINALRDSKGSDMIWMVCYPVWAGDLSGIHQDYLRIWFQFKRSMWKMCSVMIMAFCSVQHLRTKRGECLWECCIWA